MVNCRVTGGSKADNIWQLSDIENDEETRGQLTHITPAVCNSQISESGPSNCTCFAMVCESSD